MNEVTLQWDPSIDDAQVTSAFAAELGECFELFKERQRKYGRGNIAKTGEFGVWVRGTDKDARLERAYTMTARDVPDETVDDTWRDRLVYSGIALVVRKGLWPGAARFSPPRAAPQRQLDLFEAPHVPSYELGPHA